MITLHKEAKLYPNSSRDPFVGSLSLFRESDFYCKSRQTSKLPETHEFDERVIAAYEFLYEIFRPIWGAKAKPRFSSTLRLLGDSNYRTSTGNLSYHSRSRAADGNWNQYGQDVEDYIVCVVGYDLSIKGGIYRRLREIGIGSIGTYYREPEGTFIHMDTREGWLHFRKVKSHKMRQAKKWHAEWKERIRFDFAASAALGIGGIVTIPTLPTIPIGQLPTGGIEPTLPAGVPYYPSSSVDSESWEEESGFGLDYLRDVVSQGGRAVYGDDEDPFSDEYLVVKWVGRVLIGASIVVLIYRLWQFIFKRK